MNVTPITDSLSGEHIAAVFPELKPDANLGWNRRLNLFTGRALSDKALITEQQGRAGLLAQRGQMASPGAISGLEVTVEPPAPAVSPAPANPAYYHLAAGLAIDASGEDVVVPRPLRISVWDVSVYAPAALLEGGTDAPPPADSPPSNGASPPSNARVARRLGATLAELMRTGIANSLPRAGVLVLQPIVADVVGKGDPRDPCEIDPQNDAFADWQRVDGCRLVWYAWPTEWVPLPVAGDQWRNRLAYAIFNAEKDAAPDRPLPWGEVGVPIALVGFDADWVPLFADRYSVVRLGGRPKRRSPLPQIIHIPPTAPDLLEWSSVPLPGAGNPFLWQARIQQFAEQLAEIDLNATPIDQVAAQFRYLPPLGLLPKTAVDVRAMRDTSAGTNRFFPSSYRIQAAPVPLEQLDLVMQASASLVPFTLANPDQVEILVPVPQRSYDPDLLKRELVDPEFQHTLDEFATRRAGWLNRREIVRSRNSLIEQAITGTVPSYPSPDPDRLEDELDRPPVPFSSTRAHQSNLVPGLHQHYFDGATATLAVAAGDRLTTYVYLDAENLPSQVMLQWFAGDWEHRAYWGESKSPWGIEGTNSRRYMGPLPAAGQWVRLEIPANLVGLEGATLTGMAFVLVDGRAAWTHSGKSATGAAAENDTVWVANDLPAGATPHSDSDVWNWISDRELLTPFEADYQTSAVANAANPAAARQLDLLQTLKAQLSTRVASESAQVDSLGLEKFILLLQNKVNTSNDALDFHFLRVQTDIYRIRQRVLGIDEAARLVTSPVLAALAQGGESARATQEQLGSYLTKIKFNEFVDRTRTPGGGAVNAIAPMAATESVAATLASAEALPSFSIVAAAPALLSQKADSFTAFNANLADAFTTSASPFTKVGIFSGVGLQDASAQAIVPDSRQAAVATNFYLATPRQNDVLEQAPLVGAALRTVTIAQRLTDAPAVESRNFTLEGQVGVIGSLSNLSVDLSAVKIPGLGESKFGDVKNNPNIAGQILAGKNLKADEATQFNDGIRVLDDTVAALRLAEGRVQDYRTAIDLCQNTLAQLRALRDQITLRLRAIADKLAEARHDVAVARSLLAEEQARVDGINQRRDRIIQEQVPFLVFHRPRFTQVLLDAPVRTLDPGLTTSSVPACLGRNLPTPPELQSMLEVLRESPAAWFTQFPRLIDRFDRFDLLYRALQTAQSRASLFATVQPQVAITTSRFSQSLNQVFVSQKQSVMTYRAQTAQLNLNTVVGQSWRQLRDQSEVILSLADLLNGSHGRTDISQQAAKHLDDITHVATCLYADFGEVLPVIRLEWAERLSQYDAPVNLRNLAGLPRWGEIPLLQRREIQTLVDWLYQQANSGQGGAIALINDLVRVCILLASHAPVNQIIAGRLSRQTTVNLGGRIDLTVDPNAVRVGMHVLMYAANQVVARGVVEDLSVGQASARIIQTTAANLQLAANSRVQFATAEAFARSAIGGLI